jgi:hypothetical protein
MRSPASAIGKKRAGDLKRERVFFRFISKRPPTTSTSSLPLFFSLKKLLGSRKNAYGNRDDI